MFRPARGVIQSRTVIQKMSGVAEYIQEICAKLSKADDHHKFIQSLNSIKTIKGKSKNGVVLKVDSTCLVLLIYTKKKDWDKESDNHQLLTEYGVKVPGWGCWRMADIGKETVYFMMSEFVGGDHFENNFRLGSFIEYLKKLDEKYVKTALNDMFAYYAFMKKKGHIIDSEFIVKSNGEVVYIDLSEDFAKDPSKMISKYEGLFDAFKFEYKKQ